MRFSQYACARARPVLAREAFALEQLLDAAARVDLRQRRRLLELQRCVVRPRPHARHVIKVPFRASSVSRGLRSLGALGDPAPAMRSRYLALFLAAVAVLLLAPGRSRSPPRRRPPGVEARRSTAPGAPTRWGPRRRPKRRPSSTRSTSGSRTCGLSSRAPTGSTRRTSRTTPTRSRPTPQRRRWATSRRRSRSLVRFRDLKDLPPARSRDSSSSRAAARCFRRPRIRRRGRSSPSSGFVPMQSTYGKEKDPAPTSS